MRKVLPYTNTGKRVQQSDKILEKKKQKKIFPFFCTENGCNGMFSRQLDLDQHRLQGTHDYGNTSTIMDDRKFF